MGGTWGRRRRSPPLWASDWERGWSRDPEAAAPARGCWALPAVSVRGLRDADRGRYYGYLGKRVGSASRSRTARMVWPPPSLWTFQCKSQHFLLTRYSLARWFSCFESCGSLKTRLQFRSHEVMISLLRGGAQESVALISPGDSNVRSADEPWVTGHPHDSGVSITRFNPHPRRTSFELCNLGKVTWYFSVFFSSSLQSG